MTGAAVIYEKVARPLLFRVGGGDAETAHEWTLRRLAALSKRPSWLRAAAGVLSMPSAPREVFGLRFPNPVGLAAGMDKNGVALPAWPALGFGFVEVGTVTAHAQPGNDRPRMFRLRSSGAVINRMGFNNAGAQALAARLAALAAASRPGRSAASGLPVPLGISLGKSKVAPLDAATEDYLSSLRTLHPYGDYFAVNVSSPNTPGLRTLQDRSQLSELLAALSAVMSDRGPKPILVKIAPDLTDHAIADLIAVCVEHQVAGLIATNTTLSRQGVCPSDVARADQAGGLSGAPLAERARAVVGFVHKETAGALPIVGVGGIMAADDAIRMFDAGASLVQLYTGLIYRGPRLIHDIVTRSTRPRSS